MKYSHVKYVIPFHHYLSDKFSIQSSYWLLTCFTHHASANATPYTPEAMKIVNIATYDAFQELYTRYEQQLAKEPTEPTTMLLLFVASDDPKSKQSWCSDCRSSKPVIDAAIDEFRYNDQLTLAVIQVGQREEWKSKSNPYRIHKLKINAVPTLLNPKSGLRLVEGDCSIASKVSHLFSNSI